MCVKFENHSFRQGQDFEKLWYFFWKESKEINHLGDILQVVEEKEREMTLKIPIC